MPALHAAVADQHDPHAVGRKTPVGVALDDDAERPLEIEILDEAVIAALQPLVDVAVIKTGKILLRPAGVIRAGKGRRELAIPYSFRHARPRAGHPRMRSPAWLRAEQRGLIFSGISSR